MMSFLPLYIDPGTGSMLFSLFIGIAAVLTYGIKTLILRFKFIFSGGKTDLCADNKNIPFVIFSDHKRYWNVFKPICDEFEKRKINLVYYTASSDDPVFNESYKYVTSSFLGDKNKPYAKLNFLHADILLSTTPGLNVYQWKKSRYVKYYVHIPHSVSDLLGYRMFGIDHYDSILASGYNQLLHLRELEKKRPSIKEKEFTVVGSTYLDSMYSRLGSFESKSKNQKKVVLIAPSWGKSSILSKYGTKFFDILSKTDFEIIVRPHPQSIVSEQKILKPLIEKYPNFLWNFDNDNFDVLNKADVLISDFSGVIFDFALVFDKPIIYTDTNFDKSPYDIDWLDEDLWELQILSKLGNKLTEENFSSLQKLILESIESLDLQKSRLSIRDEAWANRGRAASSVVDYLILKQKELIK
ncbi:MAG: CDP-glycerol glycerophosphotransferase family protein [Treponema sp.]|nr:CDP-glycerol glycerophosphotransferase family protein [Treponema sp.]